MTETTDHVTDGDSAEQVTTEVTVNDVSLRKEVNLYRDEAVAVTFTIRSNRSDRCHVRIVDTIPRAVRGNLVDFHPNHDPTNWDRSDETVVYEAPVDAGDERTTVYGVVVDEASQLQLFSTDPDLVVTETEVADDGDAEPTGERNDDPPEGLAPGAPVDTADAGGADGPPAAGQPSDADALEDSEPGPVARLIDELERRELSEGERSTLRDALGIEGEPNGETSLASIREEIEDLREDVAAASEQADEVDRLESRLESVTNEAETRWIDVSAEIDAVRSELESLTEEVSAVEGVEADIERFDTRVASLADDVADRFDAVSAELEDLREEVERGARWRDNLRNSFFSDGDEG